MHEKILLSAKLLAKPLVKIQFRADISHEISALFWYARHEHCLTGESPEQALIAGIA